MDPRHTKNVIAKINRRCRKHGRERLCTTPERLGFTPNGDHYVIDTASQTIIRTHVDVEELAGELGIDTRTAEAKGVDEARAYACAFGATWSAYLEKLEARLESIDGLRVNEESSLTVAEWANGRGSVFEDYSDLTRFESQVKQFAVGSVELGDAETYARGLGVLASNEQVAS